MRKLTGYERGTVDSVAERWKRQYFHPVNGWRQCRGGTGDVTYERLVNLPATATPEDVAAIIGNDKWCGSEKCRECGRKAAVMLGEGPDYESHTVYICRPCLELALKLARQCK